jgi:hypothetical protein
MAPPTLLSWPVHGDDLAAEEVSCTLARMSASSVLGIASLLAGCVSSPRLAPTPVSSSAPGPADSDDPRAFLLHLLDAARSRDASAWSILQSQHLRTRDLQSGPLADLRMQAWANDLGRLEAAIRGGHVSTTQHGGRTAITVATPGQPAKAVAFVTVEDGRLRLDDN